MESGARRGNEPKQQHVVPRFYLERFADADGKVWTYDKGRDKPWSALPENTGTQQWRYSVTLDDGTRLHDVEHHLNDVETKAAGLYDKLLSGEPLVGQERADMASFFAFMFARTEAIRRQFAQSQMALTQARLHAIASADRAFERLLSDFEREEGELGEETRRLVREGMLKPEDYVISVDREWTLRALEIHDRLAPVLFRMRWTIMHADGGEFFVTSDNPLVRLIPGGGAMTDGGCFNDRAQVTMPLTPKACWLATWNRDAKRSFRLPRKPVRMTNVMIAADAEKQVYADRLDGGISNLVRKYRDGRPSLKLHGAQFQPSPVSLRR